MALFARKKKEEKPEGEKAASEAKSDMRERKAAGGRAAPKEEADLTKRLKEQREALRSFRFGIAGSKIKDVKEARKIRKEIARILTKLNR